MRRNTTFRSKCNFDVILLGDTAVGKSSLIARLLDSTSSELKEPTATVGTECAVKTILLPDAYIRLNICDTSGQKR
ncbi:hypothetical protein KR093_007739 [Drosophila rubida]|uniref:Uncharacterized protein n=1 Tax=Drosophila rubida TaxID=30044 RepID=A0AAD4K5P5_9MUSC|nr:hypothetical protein KR093_007739 [Drosophila rubida]